MNHTLREAALLKCSVPDSGGTYECGPRTLVVLRVVPWSATVSLLYDCAFTFSDRTEIAHRQNGGVI